jgi:hypothetical protein
MSHELRCSLFIVGDLLSCASQEIDAPSEYLHSRIHHVLATCEHSVTDPNSILDVSP